MLSGTFLTFLSVFAVSLIAFIGLFLFGLKQKMWQKVLLEFVAFSIGALLGEVFIHLLPEIGESLAWTPVVGAVFLAGFLVSFLVERTVHWHHCHDEEDIAHHHTKPFVYVNLIGDGIHNFVDGIIIAAAYLASVELGVATTLAVILHEIPQEIGDYAVLVHGGWSRAKALFANFLTALTAVLGAAVTVLLGDAIVEFVPYVLPFAAGAFLYIAAADLIPELHKERRSPRIVTQTLSILAGIGVMALLLLLE